MPQISTNALGIGSTGGITGIGSTAYRLFFDGFGSGKAHSLTPTKPEITGFAEKVVGTVVCKEAHNLTANDRVSVSLTPGITTSFQIEFDDCAISRQELFITLVNGTFKKEIARARTFGFVNDVEALRASGLALGGSLENAVVVDGDKVLNDGGLRYEDEFVRHKVLDAVGDLYLSGAPIRGHYRGVRAGHHLTNELLKALFAESASWRFIGHAGEEVSSSRGHMIGTTESFNPMAATA